MRAVKNDDSEEIIETEEKEEKQLERKKGEI